MTAGIDPTLPEAVRRFLASGAALESIRLDDRGQWWHRGGHIENERVLDLFYRSVSRTCGGTWVLEIGRFTYPIEVEDTPFFIDSFQVDLRDTDEVIVLSLMGGHREELQLDTLRYTEGLGLSCAVFGGRFRARFMRDPYHRLAERLVEVDGEFALVISGRNVPL